MVFDGMARNTERGCLRLTARPLFSKTIAPHRRPYHRPLIPLTLALAGGLLVGGTWPGYLPLAVVVGLAALGWILAAWYRGQGAAAAPLIIMSMLGYASVWPWLPSTFPDNHISRYTDSHPWHVEGVVIERLPARDGRTRVVVETTRLADATQTIAVTGSIRLTIAGEPPILAPGSRLAFRSRIRAFHNFSNPGGFDYERHMRFQRIYGSAFVPADRLRVRPAAAPQGTGAIADYRMRAGALIDQAADPTSQSVLKALLIGERQTILPEVRRMFNRCGVGHLLAISGLHIGIVGGLFFALFQWGLNRSHAVLDRGWGRRGAALMAVGPVLWYAGLAGLSPSTQRALIMVVAFMATYFVHKEGDTLNFLALAAVLMLIWEPPVLFSISFQMSFAAVFWILVGLSGRRPVGSPGSSRTSSLLGRCATFLGVTFWATAGTLPLIMVYFQEISLIGLVTNCIMVPLVGFFVLPSGLFALFILPIHEALSSWVMQVAAWCLSQGLQLMAHIDAVDGIAVTTFVPTGIEVACYYALLGLIARRPTIKAFPWCLMVLGGILAADGIFWLHERFWHDDLRVTVLDVGQGSSALVEFPGGETLLIDGGGYTDNRTFDVGQRIIAPFLRYRKIMQVDTVLLSHPSSDHMNGLIYVVSHFRPRVLLWTGDRASTASFAAFEQAVSASGVQVTPLAETDREVTIGGVAVRILHPATHDVGAPHRQLAGETSNNRSIVVKLAIGDCGILLPGDIEARAEAQLIDRCRRELKCQILVAPHHGSRTSSSMAFLGAVQPQVVVISAGWQNRFGFPHRAVLERYRSVAEGIYRTDRHGAVTLRSDGRQWRIASQLK